MFQRLSSKQASESVHANGFEVKWVSDTIYGLNVERQLIQQLGLRGYGLLAARLYKPNEFIIEYRGDVITRPEMQRRVKEVYASAKSIYMLNLEGGSVIDAGQNGSEARFANHSCSPNAEIQVWTVNGNLRLGLFAKDTISPGTEITYDYDLFEGSKTETCYCGAQNCRGFFRRQTISDPSAKNREQIPVTKSPSSNSSVTSEANPYEDTGIQLSRPRRRPRAIPDYEDEESSPPASPEAIELEESISLPEENEIGTPKKRGPPKGYKHTTPRASPKKTPVSTVSQGAKASATRGKNKRNSLHVVLKLPSRVNTKEEESNQVMEVAKSNSTEADKDSKTSPEIPVNGIQLEETKLPVQEVEVTSTEDASPKSVEPTPSAARSESSKPVKAIASNPDTEKDGSLTIFQEFIPFNSDRHGSLPSKPRRKRSGADIEIRFVNHTPGTRKRKSSTTKAVQRKASKTTLDSYKKSKSDTPLFASHPLVAPHSQTASHAQEAQNAGSTYAHELVPASPGFTPSSEANSSSISRPSNFATFQPSPPQYPVQAEMVYQLPEMVSEPQLVKLDEWHISSSSKRQVESNKSSPGLPMDGNLRPSNPTTPSYSVVPAQPGSEIHMPQMRSESSMGNTQNGHGPMYQGQGPPVAPVEHPPLHSPRYFSNDAVAAKDPANSSINNKLPLTPIHLTPSHSPRFEQLPSVRQQFAAPPSIPLPVYNQGPIPYDYNGPPAFDSARLPAPPLPAYPLSSPGFGAPPPFVQRDQLPPLYSGQPFYTHLPPLQSPPAPVQRSMSFALPSDPASYRQLSPDSDRTRAASLSIAASHSLPVRRSNSLMDLGILNPEPPAQPAAEPIFENQPRPVERRRVSIQSLVSSPSPESDRRASNLDSTPQLSNQVQAHSAQENNWPLAPPPLSRKFSFTPINKASAAATPTQSNASSSKPKRGRPPNSSRLSLPAPQPIAPISASTSSNNFANSGSSNLVNKLPKEAQTVKRRGRPPKKEKKLSSTPVNIAAASVNDTVPATANEMAPAESSPLKRKRSNTQGYFSAGAKQPRSMPPISTQERLTAPAFNAPGSIAFMMTDPDPKDSPQTPRAEIPRLTVEGAIKAAVGVSRSPAAAATAQNQASPLTSSTPPEGLPVRIRDPEAKRGRGRPRTRPKDYWTYDNRKARGEFLADSRNKRSLTPNGV